MLRLFLTGLLLCLGTIVVISVAVMCGAWLKEYVEKKLKNRKKHKVAFADTREMVDDYIKNKAENAKKISMEELERLCEEAPFAAAVVDENGEISEYEGFTAEKYNENFKARLKQQEGMVILGA